MALDYCVKQSALDSVKLGFKTFIIEDLCESIGIKNEIVDELKKLNINFIDSKEINNWFN